MEPTPELVREIYAEKVRRARRMTFEQKFLAGPRLFDRGCASLRTELRARFPHANNEEIEFLLRQCLAYMRRSQA
jgi:hypothetical protein